MALPGTGRAVLSRFLSLSSASPLARLSRPLSAVAWQQQDRRSALGRAAAVAAVAAAAALALQVKKQPENKVENDLGQSGIDMEMSDSMEMSDE